MKASDSGATAVSSGPHGPNVGAIAGGVVGGCAFIAIITFLVWRFFLKNRRTTFPEEEYEEDELEEQEGSEKAAGANGRRGSTSTTRRSMASTMLSRASNVIPIVFIPQVQDRANGLVPPVPMPTSNATTPYTDNPVGRMIHYFMPDDLRDSHYSGFTDDGTASTAGTAARASVTPSLLRGSVASTIYGSAAVVGTGRTAQGGKANVVSVHVPAVPRIPERFNGMSESNQVSSRTSVSQDRPLQAPAERPESEGPGLLLPTSTFSPPVKAPQAPAPSRPDRPESNAFSDAHAISDSEAAAAAASSALANPLSLQSKHAAKVSQGKADLSAIIEQATKRASRQPTHGGLGSLERENQRGQSPFGDEHAVVEEDEEAEGKGKGPMK